MLQQQEEVCGYCAIQSGSSSECKLALLCPEHCGSVTWFGKRGSWCGCGASLTHIHGSSWRCLCSYHMVKANLPYPAALTRPHCFVSPNPDLGQDGQ